jgi:hypothetical protein
MKDVQYKGFRISYIEQAKVYLVSRLARNGGRNTTDYLGEFKTLEEAKKWIRNKYY